MVREGGPSTPLPAVRKTGPARLLWAMTVKRRRPFGPHEPALARAGTRQSRSLTGRAHCGAGPRVVSVCLIEGGPDAPPASSPGSRAAGGLLLLPIPAAGLLSPTATATAGLQPRSSAAATAGPVLSVESRVTGGLPSSDDGSRAVVA